MKITVPFKPKKAEPPTKVSRIAKLMALAIHFDQLIREGKVRDQAENRRRRMRSWGTCLGRGCRRL